MVFMTLIHFAILSFRGGALYNYYHHYADKVPCSISSKARLTASANAPAKGSLLEKTRLHRSWRQIRSDQFQCSRRLQQHRQYVGTATTIIVILLSPSLAQRYGKKPSPVIGFALSALNAFAFYLLGPSNVTGMLLCDDSGRNSLCSNDSLVWAIFADVADYSEWKTVGVFTGMVFATIGFALKSGLALGSASFLMILQMVL